MFSLKDNKLVRSSFMNVELQMVLSYFTLIDNRFIKIQGFIAIVFGSILYYFLSKKL